MTTRTVGKCEHFSTLTIGHRNTQRQSAHTHTLTAVLSQRGLPSPRTTRILYRRCIPAWIQFKFTRQPPGCSYQVTYIKLLSYVGKVPFSELTGLLPKISSESVNSVLKSWLKWIDGGEGNDFCHCWLLFVCTGGGAGRCPANYTEKQISD